MKLWSLSSQNTSDRLLVEPDKILAEADCDVQTSQQALDAANNKVQQCAGTRRSLQNQFGQLNADLKQTGEFIRQGMTRALTSGADTAFAEVEKLRIKKGRLVSRLQYCAAILIPGADIDILHAEIEATEASCDKTEAEVTALRLRIMLAGAEARKHDPGATVDLKTGKTERMMASVNRDRDSTIPGEKQKLSLLIDKATAVRGQLASSLYN